ncbi:MAG TPA: carbohydrate kinase family protein [Accumulibacter sp.]|uniref:carbohydrate kinase family protein n=1 Tax=Accumulibacter sp. TaxID=2053492 RepID=UPI0025F70C29|nr:carbohydrate kinase family protein [Accumulibacter sp.]MCM8598105.1 carbohydrate kinase family protein [Accumulibacter sp.]MCM8662308.1 carbohydrate kinase family protein [Accumulibacter sp.]HNC52481.1 carbohydrate kinase family protein [Accumulibacter sp.]HNN47009.1 carbohydrate kinase family protein [Azospira sp.]
MPTLICGSIAFDNIMVFHDRFKNHILPEQIHILNVAFLVPEMRREYGGCAGNIAYNLKLLGEDPLIMATVGEDADPYLVRLSDHGLSRAHLRRIAGCFTAQAFITTDLDDNQITAFHPGAMTLSHLNRVADVPGVTLAIVAPDGRDGMLQHAADLAAIGVPFIFDPGQGMPMFSGDELMTFMRLATYACFNDYEAKLLCDRTGRTMEQLAAEVEAMVVTLGGAGSRIYADGQRYEIPCVEPDAVVDPTGCGDAYRSGLLYGIAAGWDWQKTGRLAAVMGAIKIAHRGGQNHRPGLEEIAEVFARAFGTPLW